ncbi:MAG: hypothetical protein A2Y39_05545 [Candidatus Delongbacteria bacterium GWF2_40_14]|nr:MAG: hypothetical protein A2Y39_05545 [Candidatus Delongbacteria bacterium GWF2_40_14]
MDCENYKKMIPEYVSGELDISLIDSFDKHISACENCRNELASEKNIIKNISAEEFDLPSDLNTSLIEKLPHNQFIFKKPYFAYSAAASVILMIIVSVALNFNKPKVSGLVSDLKIDSLSSQSVTADYTTYAYIDEDFENMVAYDAALYENDKWSSDNSEVFSSDDQLFNDLITLEEIESYDDYLTSL